MKIMKRAQEFSEKKLRASLKKAGAVPKAAKAAVDAVRAKIRKRTLKTTADIRRTVAGVLRKLDPRAHKRYMHPRKK
jgi:2-phosphoglycerate kinase